MKIACEKIATEPLLLAYAISVKTSCAGLYWPVLEFLVLIKLASSSDE